MRDQRDHRAEPLADRLAVEPATPVGARRKSAEPAVGRRVAVADCIDVVCQPPADLVRGRGRGARGSCSGPAGCAARTRPPRRTASSVRPRSAGSRGRPCRRSTPTELGEAAPRRRAGRCRTARRRRPARRATPAARVERVDRVRDLVAAAAARPASMPQTAIARPLVISASASSVTNSSSVMSPGWFSTASAPIRASVTARPSTGSPRTSRASSQSASALMLLTSVADAGPGLPLRAVSRRSRGRRRPRSGCARRTSRGCRRGRGCATGEAMPSWARLVATDTIGMPYRVAAYLAVSMVLPPPMPTTASYERARSFVGQLQRGVEGAAGDGEDVGRVERRPDQLRDLLALARADHDRHVAAGRDPAGRPGSRRGRRPRPAARRW